VEGKDALTQEKVLSQIKYQLSADSYTITNQYHTVMNGFAISLKNGSDADKIKAISGVETMEIAHTYAAPEDVSGLTAGTDTSEINNTATMAQKLGNYSSETMRATDGEIQTALGKDNTFANAKGKGRHDRYHRYRPLSEPGRRNQRKSYCRIGRCYLRKGYNHQVYPQSGCFPCHFGCYGNP
jgi:hypothetical protein